MAHVRDHDCCRTGSRLLSYGILIAFVRDHDCVRTWGHDCVRTRGHVCVRTGGHGGVSNGVMIRTSRTYGIFT